MTVDEVYRQFGPGRNVNIVDLRAEGFFTPALKSIYPPRGRMTQTIATRILVSFMPYVEV